MSAATITQPATRRIVPDLGAVSRWDLERVADAALAVAERRAAWHALSDRNSAAALAGTLTTAMLAEANEAYETYATALTVVAFAAMGAFLTTEPGA